MTTIKTILQLLLLVAKPIADALERRRAKKRLEHEKDAIARLRRDPFKYRTDKLRDRKGRKT